MKTTVGKIRRLIKEEIGPQVAPEGGRAVIVVPFITRGDVAGVDDMKLITISEAETEGNRSAYIAWKRSDASEEEEGELEAEANAIENHFNSRVHWTQSSERLPHPPYVKSHHIIVHLVGPDHNLINTSGVSNDYMFDDLDCYNHSLNDLGVPIS